MSAPFAGPEFELLLESVGDAFLVADIDGRIVASNRLAHELFGYPKETLHGLTVEELMPERFRVRHRNHRKKQGPAALSGTMGKNLELYGLHQSGREFPVDIDLNPVTWQDSPYLCMSVRDIRERKKAEQIRQQLSAILENTTDFVAMADVAGRVFFLNSAARSIVGLSNTDLAEITINDCMPERALEILHREALPYALREGVWSGELELRRHDGHSIPVSQLILVHKGADGAVKFFSTIARDISRQKRDEARLKRLNRTYAVLSRCNQILTRADTEVSLIAGFCRTLVEVGGYRLAWFGQAMDDEDRSVRPLTYFGHEAGYLSQARISWADNERGRGPVGTAIRTGKTTIARDTENDPFFAPWREAARSRGYRSLIALPVSDERHRPEGAVAIYSSEVDGFDNEEVRLLTELGDDLAFGIHILRTRHARDVAESLLHVRNRVIEATRNGVMITEAMPDYRLIYVNQAFEAITGYRREEVLERSIEFLFHDDRRQDELLKIRDALEHGRENRVILRNYRKDGTTFWNDLYITPVRDDIGRLTHFAAIINDVTEQKQYEEQLEYQANHDQLTGLPSRSLMNDRLTQLIASAARRHCSLAVLFLDLDQFKFINDSLGHGTGDELLKRTAERLHSCIREGDTLSRYGGDEFVLILPDMERPEDITTIANRLLQSVALPIELNGHQLQVSISIGASLYPRDGADPETLLRNADAAMYRAKEMGRNNLQFYTAELNQRAMERVTLETKLRAAIEQNQLVLHYQPRVNIRTGVVVGVEALVRWQHPEVGLVPPTKFISFAEESALIVPLGEWVLQTACAQNKAWQEEGLPRIKMAVNLSARQLTQPDLHQRVESILAATGLDADDLELELTESAIMSDPQAMRQILRRIKEIGPRLSIDDFGTGYSSLSHLRSFPFDNLKIDKSFIRNITTSPHDAEIALAIIALAHTLKLHVVAEGVETEDQLQYLQRHHCDEFQGYYFSEPLPTREATELLRRIRFPASATTL